MRKLQEIIQEKSIGIIATLLVAIVIFLTSYISSGINNCQSVRDGQDLLKEEVSQKLDRTEFMYYQKNTEEKFDNILERLLEIKQDIKEIKK